MPQFKNLQASSQRSSVTNNFLTTILSEDRQVHATLRATGDQLLRSYSIWIDVFEAKAMERPKYGTSRGIRDGWQA